MSKVVIGKPEKVKQSNWLNMDEKSDIWLVSIECCGVVMLSPDTSSCSPYLVKTLHSAAFHRLQSGICHSFHSYLTIFRLRWWITHFYPNIKFLKCIQNYKCSFYTYFSTKHIHTHPPNKQNIINYRNRFVTQYITYLNIRETLSGTLSPLSTHESAMGWQWSQCPWKRFPYIQVSDVLCYKQIPIIYWTSLLQNYLKVIKTLSPSLLAYGSEAWTINASTKQRLTDAGK